MKNINQKRRKAKKRKIVFSAQSMLEKTES